MLAITPERMCRRQKRWEPIAMQPPGSGRRGSRGEGPEKRKSESSYELAKLTHHLQKGGGVANGDSVMENAETRPNMEPADAVRRMAAKLRTEEGKEIYRRRKKIVEPVFGQMKFNLGFRRLRLRGLDKAGGEWTLVCLAHNIKKIYARIVPKGGELNDGSLSNCVETATRWHKAQEHFSPINLHIS